MKEKSTNRRSRIYDELKKRIVFGQYKPSSTLDEKKICQEFRISRTPYREALMRLEAEGLVMIKPKTGVVVPSIDLNSLKDIFEMRTILEAVAARMAFKRIQPHQLDALKKVAHEIRSLSDQEEIFPYLELDARFHAVLHSAQGNQVLKESLETLYNQCMRLWNSIDNQDLIKRLIISSVRDIPTIYDAFVAGDAARVEKEIKQHFAAYLHTLIAHLIGGMGDEFVPSQE